MKKRELVFLQFHLNETDQDFSAIDYLLFSSFQEFVSRYVKGGRAWGCIELAVTILVKAGLFQKNNAGFYDLFKMFGLS